MITEHEKQQLNELLAAGYNCSQSVMLHFLDSLPLTKEQVLRVAQPFEMGLHQGSMCGALSGGMMVLSLLLPAVPVGSAAESDQPNDARATLYEAMDTLASRFQQAMHACACEQLLGMNVNEGNNFQYAAEQGLFESVCPRALYAVVDICNDILQHKQNALPGKTH